LCSAAVTAGPFLGSDHRPIIADIVAGKTSAKPST